MREPGGRVGGRGGEERKEKGGEGTYDAVPHREREQERKREGEREKKARPRIFLPCYLPHPPRKPRVCRVHLGRMYGRA